MDIEDDCLVVSFRSAHIEQMPRFNADVGDISFRQWQNFERSIEHELIAEPTGYVIDNIELNPPMEKEIQQSREMLELQEDWDDNGAAPITADTWNRAINFLRQLAEDYESAMRSAAPVPTISPCPDGSIDLLWKTERFQLLVNVQPRDANESDFYGQTALGLKVKGTFRPESHRLRLLESLVWSA